MSLERAIAYTLAAPALSGAAGACPERSEGSPNDATSRRSRPAAAPTASGAAEALTPRAREVARLIASGCRTDRQIAGRLTITPSTAGVHVQHVLEKLGLHSRWQIADWAIDQGLPATQPEVHTG